VVDGDSAHGVVLPGKFNLQSKLVGHFNVFSGAKVKIKAHAVGRTVLTVLFLVISACSRPEFVDAQGKAFDWQDFHGQWLVVNFWAEWCAPCLEEIPELNRLHEEAGLTVVGVNFDRPELTELKRQITALDVRFPVVFSERRERLAELTPQVLPTTYVFDQQGRLRHKLVGPQTRATIKAAME
jgi:thiol-disulfide isomerase/thioredoxin